MNRIIIALSVASLMSVIASANAAQLLHYAFEQVDGSGPFTTPDSSGRGNAGTLVNMDTANLVPGRVGNALQFNGDWGDLANRLELPTDHTDFNRSYSEFTLATWLKPFDVAPQSPQSNWIAGKMGGGGNRGWQVGLTGTSPESHPHELVLGYFAAGSGSEHEVFLGPNANLVNDTWIHFAAVFRANDSVKLYVNGDLVVNDPGALSALNGVNNAAFQVGNRGNNAQFSWNGLIDEFYVFDHALTDEEVAALVPEPGGPVLAGIGLAVAASIRRRRR